MPDPNALIGLIDDLFARTLHNEAWMMTVREIVFELLQESGVSGQDAKKRMELIFRHRWEKKLLEIEKTNPALAARLDIRRLQDLPPF